MARYDPFGVDVPLNFDNTHSLTAAEVLNIMLDSSLLGHAVCYLLHILFRSVQQMLQEHNSPHLFSHIRTVAENILLCFKLHLTVTAHFHTKYLGVMPTGQMLVLICNM